MKKPQSSQTGLVALYKFSHLYLRFFPDVSRNWFFFFLFPPPFDGQHDKLHPSERWHCVGNYSPSKLHLQFKKGGRSDSIPKLPQEMEDSGPWGGGKAKADGRYSYRNSFDMKLCAFSGLVLLPVLVQMLWHHKTFLNVPSHNRKWRPRLGIPTNWQSKVWSTKPAL